jgi:hypothetical protein
MTTYRNIILSTLVCSIYILRSALIYIHIDSVSIVQSLGWLVGLMIITSIYTVIVRPHRDHIGGILCTLVVLQTLCIYIITSSWLLIIGVLCVHIAIYVVYTETIYILTDRVRIHLRSIANAWLTGSVRLIAMGYACLIIGTNRIDDITCDSIRTSSTYLISQAPADLGQRASSISLPSLWEIVQTKSPDTDVWLIDKITRYTQDIMQSLMYDKAQLDQQICVYTLGYIQSIYHSKPFIISSVILLSVLLSLFVGIMLTIVGCINWIILLLWLRVGYIHRIQEMDMVERLG